MVQFSVPFVLASGSPRRRRLLEQLGLSFEVRVPDVDETPPPDATPQDVVLKLALDKAERVAESVPGALILAADTVVFLDGDLLNKPTDEADARRMLRLLSGQTHTVCTGIAIIHAASDRCVTAAVDTRVTFGNLDDDEIARYVSTGSPMDKAGGYGIQDDYGALFVSRIDGDYYNVVGLPLHRFYRLLRTAYTDLMVL